MIAVFEDDVLLDPRVLDVLAALRGKERQFDFVKLNRLSSKAPYFPVVHLLPSHTLGRVRYYDKGAQGYVVTKSAAAHLLERFPKTHWEIDQLIPRFWENGLDRVFYVDPPVVFHDRALPSHIEAARRQSVLEHENQSRHSPRMAMRRLKGGGLRSGISRWRQFRRLRLLDRYRKW